MNRWAIQRMVVVETMNHTEHGEGGFTLIKRPPGTGKVRETGMH